MTNNDPPTCPICMGECMERPGQKPYCPTCDMYVDEDAYYGGMTDEDYDEQEQYEAEHADDD